MLASTKPRKTDSRTEVRREAILRSAIELFCQFGYAGTSTSAIVERSGGSKQTVYAYFGNKEGLFRAAILGIIESAFLGVDVLAIDSSDPKITLRRIAIESLTIASTAENFALLRLLVSEAPRFAGISARMFPAGRAPLTDDHFAVLLRRFASEGKLAIDDPGRYAHVFLSLLFAPMLTGLLFGERPTSEAIACHADTIVRMFLRMCVPEPTAPPLPKSEHDAPFDARRNG